MFERKQFWEKFWCVKNIERVMLASGLFLAATIVYITHNYNYVWRLKTYTFPSKWTI